MLLSTRSILTATIFMTASTGVMASNNCESFAEAAKSAMATKLAGKMLPGHENLMHNDMHASTSTWLLQKGRVSNELIIQDFAREWQHACAAGTYGPGVNHG